MSTKQNVLNALGVDVLIADFVVSGINKVTQGHAETVIGLDLQSGVRSLALANVVIFSTSLGSSDALWLFEHIAEFRVGLGVVGRNGHGIKRI